MFKTSDLSFCAYDFEYMGVKCTGIRWSPADDSLFRFEKDGEEFVFEQREFVECDTEKQQIENVIKYQFLPWWADKTIEDIQRRYDDLAKELDRAINYIKMTRKFSGNAEN